MTKADALLAEMAEHLEAAARAARALIEETRAGAAWRVGAAGGAAPELDPVAWVEIARELHPVMGVRQAQVLAEVAKVHPEGTGTGPIWRAINYEQTNTYLTLDALARQGLIRKDDTVRPHQYYLGDALVAHAVEHQCSEGQAAHID